MRRVAIRGLLARKLRSTLTAIAIVLGVAMVSGTLVLTDTIERAFDSIFSSAYEQTDAVVSGTKLVEWSQTGKAQISPDAARAGARAARGRGRRRTILDLSGDANQAKILDKDGQADLGQQPDFGLGVEPADERFNPFRLVEGDWASGRSEVVLDDTATSRASRSATRSRSPATGRRGVHAHRHRTLRRGRPRSAARPSPSSTSRPRSASWARTASTRSRSPRSDGVSPDGAARRDRQRRAAARRRRCAPAPSRRPRTARGIDEFLAFIRYFLLAFGGIALFVGAFVIFNTLSITVAQRTTGARDAADPRRLAPAGAELGRARRPGARRRRLGRRHRARRRAGEGAPAVFAALELDLPQSGNGLRVADGRRRVASASASRSWRRSRRPSARPASRRSRPSATAARRQAAVAEDVRRGLRRRRLSASPRLRDARRRASPRRCGSSAVGGALGLFVGVALLAPRLVNPLAHFVGAPAARLGGAAGQLARENATRNPGRTASTAAALMIGLTLVTFVAVLGAGCSARDESALAHAARHEPRGRLAERLDTVPAGAGEARATRRA